jgi:oligopeptide transport system ATP-binding protein
MTPLIEVKNLVKHFPLSGSWLKREKPVVSAVEQVSLEIHPGEVLGLAGESGCGKTTLGRCILRLIEPTSGSLYFEGHEFTTLPPEDLRQLRLQMQIVFQNPVGSLNPRMRVQSALEEPLRVLNMPRAQRKDFILENLEQVGLGEQHLSRFPHELSGGQCQRVSIARALSFKPKLLVLDEPTSALDVSVQAQIINLLDVLRNQYQLTYLFISHNLGVIEHISDRIGIMYLGKLVEIGETRRIFSVPKHPYTQALLNAVPKLKPQPEQEPVILEGNVPSPINPPHGCRFHTRCPIAEAHCRQEEPVLRDVGSGQWVACHLVS